MEERLRPIFSQYEDSADLKEEIDAFVIRLAETVDALQDAESSGDMDQLENLATELAAQAAQLGYPALEKVAKRVRVSCEDDHKEAIQESLIELTEIGRRIRLGHRGAA